MYSLGGNAALPALGCPIRKSPDPTVVCTYPRLIAAYHVLHRLVVPRHPPCALCSLIKQIFSRPLPRSERIQNAPHNENSLENPKREFSVVVVNNTRIQFSKSSHAAARRLWRIFNFLFSGGDNRDRTGDLSLAKAALSHLSYIPNTKLQ